MRKLLIFMLAAIFVLTFGCGKSDQAGSESQSDPHQMGQKPDADSREGGKPEADAEDIDVDKLDIPD
ncbi:MAG: hypothetical protein WBF32_12225, partial [Candidatus Aminicenantaceae bacterium]